MPSAESIAGRPALVIPEGRWQHAQSRSFTGHTSPSPGCGSQGAPGTACAKIPGAAQDPHQVYLASWGLAGAGQTAQGQADREARRQLRRPDPEIKLPLQAPTSRVWEHIAGGRCAAAGRDFEGFGGLRPCPASSRKRAAPGGRVRMFLRAQAQEKGQQQSLKVVNGGSFVKRWFVYLDRYVANSHQKTHFPNIVCSGHLKTSPKPSKQAGGNRSAGRQNQPESSAILV